MLNSHDFVVFLMVFVLMAVCLLYPCEQFKDITLLVMVITA